MNDSSPSLELFSGSMSSISVFVVRGGSQAVVIHIAEGAFVSDLVDAVIDKLKLDVTAEVVTLRLVAIGAGGAGPPPRCALRLARR